MNKNKDIFDHLKKREIRTPDSDYFKKLSEDILNADKPKIIPFYRKPITWVSAAAAAIAIILITNVLTNDYSSQADPLLALNDCSTAEISAYIENNIHHFETELIEEFVPEDSLSIAPIIIEQSTPENQEDLSLSLDEVEEEDILEYFDEYELDPYTLEEEDIFI